MSFENVQVFRSDPTSSTGGLAVTEFGKQLVSGHIIARKLQDYAVVFVERGRGTLTTKQGGTQVVVGPAVFWLFPDQLHSYGPDKETTWLERWVLFRGSLVDDFQQKGLLDLTQPLVAPVKLSEVVHTFSTLHSEMIQRDTIGWASAAATIHRLVIQVASQSATGKLHDAQREISRIARLLSERAFEEINMEELADELQMSSATLRRKCVAHLGIAPKHYQLQLRIDRAKELLASTELSVENIARTIGYEDSFYFSRLFFKREHRSPSEFRKLHTRI